MNACRKRKTTTVSYEPKPELNVSDYTTVGLLWIIYFIALVMIIHFLYVFKTYYDDPVRILNYERAHSSFERCLTETDPEFKIQCASRKRWAMRWYWVNILDDVLEEHVDHLRNAPQLPSLFGSWGHMQFMKLTESLVNLIQTVTGSVWYLIPVLAVLVLGNVYLFCRFPMQNTWDVYERRQEQMQDRLLALNKQAQQNWGHSGGSLFLPLEEHLQKGASRPVPPRQLQWADAASDP
jgi:hypothetical protein